MRSLARAVQQCWEFAKLCLATSRVGVAVRAAESLRQLGCGTTRSSVDARLGAAIAVELFLGRAALRSDDIIAFHQPRRACAAHYFWLST